MNRHGRRQGLTLLEVLLATVLLAIIAAACAPAIARAITCLQAAQARPLQSIQAADLEMVADEFIEHASASPPLHQIDAVQIPWPDHPPVLVRAIRSSDPHADHLWLSFECDGSSVRRWIEVPAEQRRKAEPP